MANTQSRLEYARRSTIRVGRPTHSDAVPEHLILYDGVCGLCYRLNQFVLPRDRQRIFRFAAIQSATGRRVLKEQGITTNQLTTFYVISNFESANSALLDKDTATLFVVGQLGWPWKCGLLLRLLPRRLLEWGYERIAKSRYKSFGRYETCMTPSPVYRDRFLDAGD